MRVLVVEDSKMLLKSVLAALQESGYAVDIADNGDHGLALALAHDYDVVILDIMLPGIDGLSILHRLREYGNETQVLFLTAKDTLDDRVHGLQMGADDYLVKPFALKELLARVQVLCRRTYGKRGQVLRVADLELDTVAKRVTRGGQTIELAAREYSLLEYMMMRAGTVVSRSQIEAHIYDDLVSPMSNVVDSAIYAVRKKISVSPDSVPLIHTRRGLGYVLEAQEG